MGNKFDGWCVLLTLTQVKKIEKIFIANNVPFFTDGILSWDNANYNRIAFSNQSGKLMIAVSKFVKHVVKYKLKDKLQAEFQTDIVTWIKNNKQLRNDLKSW